MTEKIYPCCDSRDCPICFGSGVALEIIAAVGDHVVTRYNVGNSPAGTSGTVQGIEPDGTLNINFGGNWLRCPPADIPECLIY